jgi:hypothetical protein
MDLPSQPVYWEVIRTHFLPTAERLGKWAEVVAKSVPSLRRVEFRVDDAPEHPERDENPTPLVFFRADVVSRNTELKEVVLQKRYEDRIPEGTPEMQGFDVNGWNAYPF